MLVIAHNSMVGFCDWYFSENFWWSKIISAVLWNVVTDVALIVSCWQGREATTPGEQEVQVNDINELDDDVESASGSPLQERVSDAAGTSTSYTRRAR